MGECYLSQEKVIKAMNCKGVMTFQELAVKAEISISTIYKIEKGEPFGLPIAKRIAKTLDVELKDLL